MTREFYFPRKYTAIRSALAMQHCFENSKGEVCLLCNGNQYDGKSIIDIMTFQHSVSGNDGSVKFEVERENENVLIELQRLIEDHFGLPW